MNSLLTDEQRRLMRKHGTPREFARACEKAANDLFITEEEMRKGIEEYQKEWDDAGKQNNVEK